MVLVKTKDEHDQILTKVPLDGRRRSTSGDNALRLEAVALTESSLLGTYENRQLGGICNTEYHVSVNIE